MIKDGYIRIKEKIYFEYYELEKPYLTYSDRAKDFIHYQEAMKEYEASKRLVKVSNVFYGKISEAWLYEQKLYDKYELEVEDGQPCKAEVNGTATIVELIN